MSLKCKGTGRKFSATFDVFGRLGVIDNYFSVDGDRNLFSIHHHLFGEPCVVLRWSDKIFDYIVKASSAHRIALRVIDLRLVAIIGPSLGLKLCVEIDSRICFWLRHHFGLEVKVFELNRFFGIGANVKKMAAFALCNDLAIDDRPAFRPFIHFPSGEALSVKDTFKTRFIGWCTI